MRAEVGGELLVIDVQGIAHLVEEASDGVGADDGHRSRPAPSAIFSVVRRDHSTP